MLGRMVERRLPAAKWWTVRRAQNRKPATYTCPLCGRYLPALGEHVLIAPEGDSSRRRHAHTDCVIAARRTGRLPTRDEWRAAQRDESGPRGPGALRRAIHRFTGRSG
jgi:hypothetical protein